MYATAPLLSDHKDNAIAKTNKICGICCYITSLLIMFTLMITLWSTLSVPTYYCSSEINSDGVYSKEVNIYNDFKKLKIEIIFAALSLLIEIIISILITYYFYGATLTRISVKESDGYTDKDIYVSMFNTKYINNSEEENDTFMSWIQCNLFILTIFNCITLGLLSHIYSYFNPTDPGNIGCKYAGASDQYVTEWRSGGIIICFNITLLAFQICCTVFGTGCKLLNDEFLTLRPGQTGPSYIR